MLLRPVAQFVVRGAENRFAGGGVGVADLAFDKVADLGLEGILDRVSREAVVERELLDLRRHDDVERGELGVVG